MKLFKLITVLSGTLLSGAGLQASEALVTTDWLANNLESRDVRVLEVSVEAGKYEQGHIPGAGNLVWHTDLVDNPNRDIVTRENFENLMSRFGVTPETTVVLYGDHDNWFAAWGVWVFHVYGHTNVKLLDGGRRKWEAERRPMDTMTPTFRRSAYEVTNVNDTLRAFLPDVVAAARGEKDAVLVDIRTPDEFSGRVIAPAGIQELAIRAGHVPGAVNVPWNTAVNPADGTLLSAENLRDIYAQRGIDGTKPVIVYCRIGERSAHTWFVLSQILGYDVLQYDGSWTEYGNAVGVPINNPTGTVWTGK
ncbi:MAG: sulfurtransferase [Verrucomicrobia bacterium]|nr:sulfurtransferase [Verrucomicrobiota bacterium]MCH8528462.1 sulfurtransferase [Kiritimatiellia bacterium]